jgi:hypothetical protein
MVAVISQNVDISRMFKTMNLGDDTDAVVAISDGLMIRIMSTGWPTGMWRN